MALPNPHRVSPRRTRKTPPLLAAKTIAVRSATFRVAGVEALKSASSQARAATTENASLASGVAPISPVALIHLPVECVFVDSGRAGVKPDRRRFAATSD